MPTPSSPLHTIPNRFPDEWYLSYIFRLHLLTGMPSVEHSIKSIFGERLILSHVTPKGIVELAALTPESASLGVNVLLRENTTFPYLRPFAFDYTEEEYLGRYIGDDLFLPSPAARAAGSRLGLAKRQPRFCIHCLREDEQKWGISYFHRTHQVPEITICVIHETTLRSQCTECGPLPWPPYGLWSAGKCRKCNADLGAQGGSTLVHANFTADLRIAQLITQLLDANLPLFDIAVLQNTYREELYRKSFMNSTNTLNPRKFVNAVIAQFGEQFMREIHMPPYDAILATPKWARLVLMKYPSTRPLEHCVIIIFLFGSFDNFIEAYSRHAKTAGQQHAFFSSIAAYSKIKESTVAWRRSQEIPVPVVNRLTDPKSDFDQIRSFHQLFLAGKSRNSISIITGQNMGRVNKFAEENPELELIRKDLCYKIKFDAHKKKLDIFFELNPKGTLFAFQRFVGSRDDWLKRNEPKWLNEQFCARERMEHVTDDQKYKDLLEFSILSEYEAIECTRISISRMRLELKISTMLKRPREEFPLFWKMLDTYLETPDEFIGRRVKTAFLRNNSQTLTISSILNYAGIGSKCRRKELAKEVAEELLSGRNGAKFLKIGPLTPI